MRRRNKLGLPLASALWLLVWSIAASAAPLSWSKEFHGGAAAAFPGGSSYLMLNIVRLPDREALDVLLAYHLDIDSSHYLGGFGFIPPDSFEISETSGNATLAVDLSAVPDFVSVKCEKRIPNRCTLWPGAVVRMDWVNNGGSRSFDESSSRTLYRGGRTNLQQISSWGISADVRGTVDEYSFRGEGDVSGRFGPGH